MICKQIFPRETEVTVVFAPDEVSTEQEEYVLSPNRWKLLRMEFDLPDVPPTPFPIGETFYHAVAAAQSITLAVREGARLLAFAPCSGRELIRKLTMRGFSREDAAETVRFLTQKGVLNELAQAMQYALSVKKKYGPRRVQAYLQNRGYTGEALRAAQNAVPPEETRAALCSILQKRYSPFPEEPNARKKAIASLMRLGFSSADIFAVLRERDEDE